MLLTWPPYEMQFALRVAQGMVPGQLLVYEGESQGGCTGDDAFFEFVSQAKMWEPLTDMASDLNAVHVTFETSSDHWMVWRCRG